MISVCFQGKQFNITVIQVYSPKGNAEEAEVKQFCEDLLEKEMAAHSSILAWRILWTEESLVGCCPWGHTELDTTEAS